MASPTRARSLYSDEQGRMVEVTEPLADPISFSPQGGGFGYSMARAEFEKRFRPCELPGMHLIRVTADWLPEGIVLDAYSNGEHWNGWATPHFTLEAAKRLLPHMDTLRYDEQRDAFIAKDAVAPEPDGEEVEVFTAEEIDVDGAKLKVYAIGSHCWCWDTADDELEASTEHDKQS